MSKTAQKKNNMDLNQELAAIREKLAEAEALTEVSLRLKDAIIDELVAECQTLRERNRRLEDEKISLLARLDEQPTVSQPEYMGGVVIGKADLP